MRLSTFPRFAGERCAQQAVSPVTTPAGGITGRGWGYRVGPGLGVDGLGKQAQVLAAGDVDCTE